MKPFLAMASAIMFFLVSSSAFAVEKVGKFVLYPDAPDAVVLSGVIDGSTASSLKRALAKRPKAKYVVLHSPGGYVDDALAAAQIIRGRGMHTVIPNGLHCLSACAYMFFAGKEHLAAGQLGVHRISLVGGGNASMAAAYNAQVTQELRRYGVPKGVLDRMNSTPPSKMHVFSKKEIANFSINRGNSARAQVLAKR